MKNKLFITTLIIFIIQKLNDFINDENEGLPYYSRREFQRLPKAVISGKGDQILVELR
ncbi:MAG: hypothetical protein Q8858_12185 [Bacteroidota bacterium]|nr:hypothetical protein [Bacteroidota bacterium]